MNLVKLRNLFAEPITEEDLWARYGIATIYKAEKERREFLAKARRKYPVFELYQTWKRMLQDF